MGYILDFSLKVKLRFPQKEFGEEITRTEVWILIFDKKKANSLIE